MALRIDLEEFVRSLPLAIVFCDKDGCIQEANPETTRLFGYERGELVGRPIEILVPDAVRGGHVAHRQSYMERPTARRIGVGRDLLGRRKSGEEFPIEVSLHPFPYEGGTGVAAIVSDITERKRAEEERRRFDLRVQESQKLESLGLMAGGIAHDFNNLLAIVLGNAGLAGRKLDQASPAVEHLTRIEETAERAAELANQLLAYSGRGRFVVQPVNLSELVEGISSLLEASISKKATLYFRLNKDLPKIEVDVVQMRQILLNLVTNASEAIGGDRGMISLSTGIERLTREHLADALHGEGVEEGDFVYVEVSDTGCGIGKEALGRLFEPFFSTKAAGRGLGLAAVMGIVRGHRGALKVYSEVGQGTSFKVLLPAGAGERARAEPERAAPPSAEQRTILVVDDEPLIIKIAADILRYDGYRVLTAGGGYEALALFRRHGEEIDCVLLDMMMRDLNGDEVFRQLRNIRPDIRVILSSGYNEQDMTRRFVGRGLAGFIRKPYSPSSLTRKIDEILKGVAK